MKKRIKARQTDAIRAQRVLDNTNVNLDIHKRLRIEKLIVRIMRQERYRGRQQEKVKNKKNATNEDNGHGGGRTMKKPEDMTDAELTQVLRDDVMGWADIWVYTQNGKGKPVSLFDPLTDANDMLTVIDALCKMNFAVYRYSQPGQDHECRCMGNGVGLETHAPTVQHAVAVAAVKAVQEMKK